MLLQTTPMRDLSTPTDRRIVAACRGRLARLPFAGHPALRFDPWLEGYRNYLFGARAGPSISVSTLFHELGHASQFGPESFRTRATDEGYHFKMRKVVFNDVPYDEPRTNHATVRELEAFACQLHLMRAAGIKVSDREFTTYSGKLMHYMADSYFVPGKTDAAKARWCTDRISREYGRRSQAEVLDRLEAWLDATQRRWKRKRLALADIGGYSVAPCIN